MPETNIHAAEAILLEETDDILSKIPSWLSTATFIASALIAIIGTLLFFIFYSLNHEGNAVSIVKIYPEIHKVKMPLFAQIDEILRKDGELISEGDTILNIFDISSNTKKHIIADHSGRILLSPLVLKGNVLEKDFRLGVVFSDSINYQIMGKFFTDQDPMLKSKSILISYDSVRLKGKTVGWANNNELIFSVPVTKHILRKFIMEDSIAIDIVPENNISLMSLIK